MAARFEQRRSRVRDPTVATVAAVYTVDASVFVSAFNPAEPDHPASHRLLTRLRDTIAPIAVPTLVLPEVAAAISRVRQDAQLAREFATQVARLPTLVLVPLDATLAHSAVEIAAAYRLRGSDAVYVSVALRFGSLLVTLDRQQAERAKAVVAVSSPADA